MTPRSWPAIITVVVALATPAAGETPQNAERLKWWREARFGMFIHWGPVSLKGTEIGWSRGAQVPIEEYDSLYKQFNPAKFNADEWASVAKAAGMKYVIFTSKHHDGFCMWNTRQTGFNIMNSPFKRDVLKELAAACRRQGLAFGTYYSVCDWHHPDFPLGSPGGKTKKSNPNLEAYTEYLKRQVSELIRDYGPLCTMWFDVPQGFDAARGQGVIDFVRSLQPDILINNRCRNPGDFDTPEQRIGGFNLDRPWETCMTINSQWAWKPDDPPKSLKQCLRALLGSAAGDGNLLFNVGPNSAGEIEPEQVQRLKEMGQWLARYGESVYGTRGGPFKPTASILSTRKGNAVYLHVLQWTDDEINLPLLPRKIKAGTLLTGGRVQVRQAEGRLAIRVPRQYRQDIDTLVKLELDGPALDIAPIELPGPKAAASNVYQNRPQYGPDKAVDNNPSRAVGNGAGSRERSRPGMAPGAPGR